MIGVVHLVTLGWISGSILGALFIVGPLELRMPMPVGRLDYWAFAFYTIGVSQLHGCRSHWRPHRRLGHSGRGRASHRQHRTDLARRRLVDGARNTDSTPLKQV